MGPKLTYESNEDHRLSVGSLKANTEKLLAWLQVSRSFTGSSVSDVYVDLGLCELAAWDKEQVYQAGRSPFTLQYGVLILPPFSGGGTLSASYAAFLKLIKALQKCANPRSRKACKPPALPEQSLTALPWVWRRMDDRQHVMGLSRDSKGAIWFSLVSDEAAAEDTAYGLAYDDDEPSLVFVFPYETTPAPVRKALEGLYQALGKDNLKNPRMAVATS